MVSYFLLAASNRRQQYRATRRTTHLGGRLTGAIILHDAENVTDLIGPDGGAEAVARYIRDTRTDPGSYHVLTDRDSTVFMAPYEYEVWHDTTSNNYAIGISVAWRKADLPKMTYAQRESYYRRFAQAVLHAAAWVKREKGITVPLGKFQTRAHITSGKPGLSTHSRMDPTRRSDPFGTGSKYEREFLAVLADEAGTKGSAPTPTTGEDVFDMAISEERLIELLIQYGPGYKSPESALGSGRKTGERDDWSLARSTFVFSEMAAQQTGPIRRDGKDMSLRQEVADTKTQALLANRRLEALTAAVAQIPGVDADALAAKVAAAVKDLTVAEVADAAAENIAERLTQES